MLKFRDVYKLHTKYIDFLLEKTYLSNQYIKNIHLSGSEIENNLRELISGLLPQRFRVTHGYILSAKNKIDEPLLSSQIDVIIVDTLVPHSLFTIDKNNGMEIVPLESVVGIFEIKRKLNKISLLGTKKQLGALKYLKGIVDSLDISKKDENRFLPGGLLLSHVIQGGYRSNPIIGIISVDHDKSFANMKNISPLLKDLPGLPIDMVFSLKGLFLCLSDPSTGNLIAGNPYPSNPSYTFFDSKTNNQITLIAKAFGYIIAYLTTCVGRQLNFENYFFNDNLK